MRLALAVILSVPVFAAGCQEEDELRNTSGVRSGSGGGSELPAGGATPPGGGGAGGGGDPDAGDGPLTSGADIVGSQLTLWTETETERFEVVLHLDGLQLPATFEFGAFPEDSGRPRGRLTEVGPPIAVFTAARGEVELTTCPGAVGDRARGSWLEVQLEEDSGDDARRVDGPFDLVVRTAEDPDIACVPGAPAEGEGEGEGEGGGEGEAPCPLTADGLCTPGASGPCCGVRQQVDNCHEECSFGVCLDPQADTCPPCLEGCIQNIVDAACLDRYIALSRCEFAGGCVGTNDPDLTCSLKGCCEELGAAFTAE